MFKLGQPFQGLLFFFFFFIQLPLKVKSICFSFLYFAFGVVSPA